MKKHKYLIIAIFIAGLVGMIWYMQPVDKSNMVMMDVRIWKDTPGWPLAKAVRQGNVGKVRHLVENGMPVDIREPKQGLTVLFGAVWKVDKEMVHCLLELGADPNLKIKVYDYNVSTAFMEACRDVSSYEPSTKDIVIDMLEHGAKPNTVARTKTALGAACRYTDLTFVKLLVEKYQMDVNVETPQGYCSTYIESTPLASAIFNERFDTALYLLQQGANPDKAILYSKDSDENPLTFWTYIENTDKKRPWAKSSKYEEIEKEYQAFRSYIRERYGR